MGTRRDRSRGAPAALHTFRTAASKRGRRRAPELRARWTTARWTRRTFARDVDLQHTPRHALTIELPHRRIAVLIRHLNEAESARPARLSILDQYHLTDRAILLEDFANSLLIETERKITNVELCHFRIQATPTGRSCWSALPSRLALHACIADTQADCRLLPVVPLCAFESCFGASVTDIAGEQTES